MTPCTGPTQASLALVPQLAHPDLGARMRHAFRHVLAAGHRRAAIVGTDIPDISGGLVERALRALGGHQVGATVAGPVPPVPPLPFVLS